MHAVTGAVLRRMPRTIFRATDRRRSSRLGAAAAPDVPEMDMSHKRRGMCPGMRAGRPKTSGGGQPARHTCGLPAARPSWPAARAVRQLRALRGGGAWARRGRTFWDAGRAREAGGAPRLAEDVGLISLGTAQPAHPPSLLAPAPRAARQPRPPVHFGPRFLFSQTNRPPLILPPGQALCGNFGLKISGPKFSTVHQLLNLNSSSTGSIVSQLFPTIPGKVEEGRVWEGQGGALWENGRSH